MWVRESGLGVWAKGCALPLHGPSPWASSAGCRGAKAVGRLLGGAEVVAGSVARSLRLGSGVEVRACAQALTWRPVRIAHFEPKDLQGVKVVDTCEKTPPKPSKKTRHMFLFVSVIRK